MQTVIYISGYGRSGSTILERMIAQHPKTLSSGELLNFDYSIDYDENCSCGEKIKKCDQWKEISQSYLAKRKVENKYAKFFFGKITVSSIKNIFLIFSLLFKFNENINYVVDSSKSTRKSFFRPLIISFKFNIKLLHIVRDGRACFISNAKLDNAYFIRTGKVKPVRFAFIRTLINWNLINYIGLFSAIFFRNKFMIVKYENFTNKYEDSSKTISDYLFNDGFAFPQKLKRCHVIRGNRLSKEKELIVVSKKSNLNQMGKGEYFIFTLLSFPLLLLFKYPIFRNTK